MTHYTRTGAFLLIALTLWGGAVSAVHAQANLELTKTLYTKGSIFAGDKVIWNITLTNSGTEAATGIVVREALSGPWDEVEASDSTSFDTATGRWTIGSLAGDGASATLNLTMTIAADAAEGQLNNCVEILSSTPAQDAGQVCTAGEISPTVGLDITVKPETLNLKSRGVFTVFIRFSEETSDYNFGDLKSLECNGAKPKKMKVNQKDGGTLLAKYWRQDLVDVTAGDQVTITCEVTISGDDGDVKFTGSDTIRVIGEKKKGLDKLFSGILDTILPVDDEAGASEDGSTTATTTPAGNGEQARNRGQLKKAERNGDNTCTGDCTTAAPQETRGKGKKSGDDDQNPAGSGNSGNQGKEKDDSDNNGNGKDESNKPDNEKGNGKNKE